MINIYQNPLSNHLYDTTLLDFSKSLQALL